MSPDPLFLEVRRTFAAPPARVFAAWTRAEALRQWLSPVGYTTPEAEVDLREGGAWRVAMQRPEGDTVSVGGRYLAIEPPERLEFTWRWEGSDAEETRVTVTFRPIEGGTEVVIHHAQFADAEVRDQHREGWHGCLASLDQARPWA